MQYRIDITKVDNQFTYPINVSGFNKTYSPDKSYVVINSTVPIQEGVGIRRATPADISGLASIDEAKAKKLAEIVSDFTTSIELLKGGYTEDEIKSWDKQEDEARRFDADPIAQTPLIDAIISSSSDTKAELVASIIANSDMFTAAYGHFLGIKQKRADALKAVDLYAPDAVTQINNI